MKIQIDPKYAQPETGQAGSSGLVQLPLVKTGDKLRALGLMGMKPFELAVATGCSVRTVEDRRRKLKVELMANVVKTTKFDIGIDNLYSLVVMMGSRYRIEATNIRAWLLGRSPYLEDQRPVSLLAAREFPPVREAAIAFATCKPPHEFLEGLEQPVPTVKDALEG